VRSQIFERADARSKSLMPIGTAGECHIHPIDGERVEVLGPIIRANCDSVICCVLCATVETSYDKSLLICKLSWWAEDLGKMFPDR
jgi:hypothetical protein